jgi:FkbM family methyltransferase
MTTRGRFDRVEIGLAFVLVLIGAWGASATVPGRYLWMTTRGRVDDRCDLTLARNSDQRERARLDGIARLVQRTPPPEPDGDLLRWQPPQGVVWTPNDTPAEYAVAIGAVDVTATRWEWIDGLGRPAVARGEIVIDCGGHLGESAKRALQLGASRVVTIEPDPDNLRALRRNLAIEIADGRVLVVPKGVYDRTGWLSFAKHDNSASGEFVEGAADENALPVTTIDALVTELQLPRVDVVKMDIEGSEVPALHGAVATLRRFKPRLAIGTYHRQGDLAGVEAAVRAARPDYASACSRCVQYQGRLFSLLFYFY